MAHKAPNRKNNDITQSFNDGIVKICSVTCLLYTSTAYPALEGAIIHSDRGTQYTSESYRQTIREHHIHQSMNSAGGRCHDNARCESMWARMKTEPVSYTHLA